MLLFSLKIEHTALIGIIGICEMPLFFVVSGYLTHKEREENFKRMLSRLLIRSRTLLVPLVYGLLCEIFVMEQYLILYQIFIGGGIGSFSHCGGAMC